MSVQSKTALNTAIDTDITTNGNNDITGAELNSILGNMVDSYEDFIGSYTTAQIAALTGMTLRQRVFNTTDNDYEYYDGTRWVKEAHPKYKVYVASLTQTGTDAPVATVLENTLGGTVVWSYSGVGDYVGTLAAAFPSSKTAVFMQGFYAGSGFAEQFCAKRASDNTIQLDSATSGALDNNILDNTAIEIRVYY